ncbi:hypothetical protein H3Z85_01015 [Chryseobacterium indologenes]|uniref:Uncharacterized protein n=1 Tax=Chryseobacterium indologenes TaxID=253 RepID=A0A5R9PKN8_CHRID|nr:hypothetical protein [Chryseobacterium indologenes]ATN05964.1 hypothetical protein CRN76_11400 [Chryseobacterium indologenes]AYY85275.1 hypothetical protein EGX91_12340 [Chryseobacterium indologenes]AYZ34950.1 hypothetical protein EGY07_04890 [Chryseobacterium indologenes]AZB17840.1 hypothetical protein EG352_08665 [Chryseobacterium indologenes]MBF6643564.1 hypothetical protein [Chryseobacterium indologenes]
MKKLLVIVLSTIMVSSLFAQKINKGQTLSFEKRYYSENGDYYLIFQNDGNLVLYNERKAPLWASNTEGRGNKAIFQPDGNLVVYDRANKPVFSADTYDKSAEKLVVQDDGNLVIYNNRNNALWASKSSAGSQSINNNTGIIYKDKSFGKEKKMYSENGQYYLVFQNDGNLVLYNYRNSPIWASNTDGRGSRALFQPDGNLVVYDRANRPVFSADTYNKGVDRLVVQNDGNLVIYGNSNYAVWASKSSEGSKSGTHYTGTIYRDKSFSKEQKFYSENGQHYLVFQNDGNLVLYNDRNSPVWATNTEGRGVRALFQADGNLVVYDRSNRPVFSADTYNKNSDRLVIQNDGNLVIYNTSNAAVWAVKR